MYFEFSFYSSLLLISFSQGILYSVLLFIKAVQKENQSNYWLSLFVLLCSLYVAPWMLGFAGWYDKQPYRDILFYFPFQQLFFIGPVVFFYTQRLLNPSFRVTKKELIHLIPGALYLLYTFTIWVYDVFILGDYYFYKDGADKDFDSWYQNAGLLSMIVYFVLSIRYYNAYRRLIFQVASFADSVLFKWIKNYLYAFLVMLLLPILFDTAVYFHPHIASYQGSWWYFLSFSLVTFYIAITGYNNAVNAKIPFHVSGFQSQRIFLLGDKKSEAGQEAVIDIEHETFDAVISPEILTWKNKIDSLLRTEKLYQDPELTLTQVSKRLQTNASVVSKAINQGYQMNFNDFINGYRVASVKEMLANGEHKKQTLLGIAYDSGFNSKATFNRAFKKNTGLSPKEYLSQQYAQIQK